jgi:hypothetical protein
MQKTPAFAVRRAVPGAVLVALALAFGAGCDFGDGEGGRYVGRVTSVTKTEICVGPSSSSDTETCGAVPKGQFDLPQVGQCVGLFDRGRSGVVWTADSIRRSYKDSDCK